MDEILKNLNEEQRNAVTALKGPVLIVAGAGSGKTRVLTSKIAWAILEKNTDPSQILALTFTKKAAGEMKERIANMVGGRAASKIWMGTFHSVFIKFLREYAECLGYHSDFTIYDTTDSQNAIKQIIAKEISVEEKDKKYKPKEVLSRISNAKNELMTAADYAADSERIKADARAGKTEIAKIFRLYENACKTSDVMDFDDILLNMNRLLRDFPDACSNIAGRFSYILVDEYQDTNRAQYVILKRFSAFCKNITVVGDDSQSIYAFRGARVENILSFEKDFSNARIFRLVKNYRSTENIVEAANSLIERNFSRIPKKCVSTGVKGELIHVISAYSDKGEAGLIASSIISRLGSDGASYKDFAILYRTNSQSRALEEGLRTRNLPYYIWAGNSFYERQEVKDVMAYLKLIVNPSDDVSFRRVINLPTRGIGGTTLEVLRMVASASGIPLMDAIGDKASLEAAGLKEGAINRLTAFREMILSHTSSAKDRDCYEIALSIASDSGIGAYYKSDKSIEGLSREANVEELLNSIADFKARKRGEWIESLIENGTDIDSIAEENCPIALLSDYLEDIALLSNADVSDEDASNRIALMTVHSAKGLEFPYVYVAGMEDKLFPLGDESSSIEDIEEERRLFYVAMTRAQKVLTLSYSETRIRNGELNYPRPSRFLKEIDPQYIENPLQDAGRKSSFVSVSASDGSPFRPFGQRPSGGPSAFGQRSSGGSSPFGGGTRRFFGDSPRPASSGGSSAKPSGFSRPSPAAPKPAPSRPGVFHSRAEAASRELPPEIPDFVPTLPEKLAEGDLIEHNRFGKGKILSITGTLPDAKARIAFDSYGEKTLLLTYAKLRKL